MVGSVSELDSSDPAPTILCCEKPPASTSDLDMAIVPKRHPQPKHLAIACKRKPKDALLNGSHYPPAASSAKSLEKKQCWNLTMYGWLTVFAYIDSTQDDEDGSNNDSLQPAATSELITLAEQQVEAGYISRVGADSSPELLHHLCACQAELHREQLRNAKQTVLGSHGFVKIP